MKLVIEHHTNGVFYVYREDEKHHDAMNRYRYRDRGNRKTLKECDNDCELARGQYVVVDLKKGQK